MIDQIKQINDLPQESSIFELILNDLSSQIIQAGPEIIVDQSQQELPNKKLLMKNHQDIDHQRKNQNIAYIQERQNQQNSQKRNDLMLESNKNQEDSRNHKKDTLKTKNRKDTQNKNEQTKLNDKKNKRDKDDSEYNPKDLKKIRKRRDINTNVNAGRNKTKKGQNIYQFAKPILEDFINKESKLKNQNFQFPKSIKETLKEHGTKQHLIALFQIPDYHEIIECMFKKRVFYRMLMICNRKRPVKIIFNNNIVSLRLRRLFQEIRLSIRQLRNSIQMGLNNINIMEKELSSSML